jgi:hypothetical protein
VLEAGESFVLDRNGRALLTPIGKANICIAHESSTQTCQSRAKEERGRSVFSPVHPLLA